ncbi:MAG: MotA/TolQ/ExbB proton channel family protein [bacterium]
MISQQISILASYGAQIILVVLMFLSVLVLGFFIERMIFFRRNFIKKRNEFIDRIRKTSEKSEISDLLHSFDTSETKIILTALNDNSADSPENFRNITAGIYEMEKQNWETFLMFFASTGANAPFAGLLGTVLGLMQAFSDLALAANPDATAAMNGISNALITTVAGITIAIPCVIIHNHFRIKIKRTASLLQSASDIIASKKFFR